MMGLKYIAFYVLIALNLTLQAQQAIVKVSKLKQLSYKQGVDQVSIQGEKATIKVEAWAEKFVSVSIKCIARNMDKKEAIADLGYIKYQADVNGSTLKMSNTFKGVSKNITSNLSIEYQIKMPVNTKLIIANLYGPVHVSGIADVDVNVSFGRIALSDISKSANIQNRYSDLDGENFTGQLSIESDKSNIQIKGLTSKTQITSQYGSVDISELNTVMPLNIIGTKTEVIIEVPRVSDYNYDLKSVQGKVEVSGHDDIDSDLFFVKNDDAKAWLTVRTSYNTIKIQTK